MQVGTGKSILNGIAIGKLKIYKKKDTAISAAEVADTAAEVARFEEAQQKAIEQQTALYEKAAKPKDKMPKIYAQAEEKVKFAHFCHICMFNCTKILHKKLAI